MQNDQKLQFETVLVMQGGGSLGEDGEGSSNSFRSHRYIDDVDCVSAIDDYNFTTTLS